jgi:hypothetical protein
MDYNLKNKSREHTDINSSEVTILLIEGRKNQNGQMPKGHIRRGLGTERRKEEMATHSNRQASSHWAC